jgi:hypothetical protein
MKLPVWLVIFAFAQSGQGLSAPGQERRTPLPTQWCYAARQSLEVRAKPGDRKAPLVNLGQGALVAGFESKSSGGRTWIRVLAVDPAKILPTAGWIDATRVEILPADEFPTDREIMELVGGVFLDDFVEKNTAVTRYLLHIPGRDPALLCYLGSVVLPHTRLQVFFRAQGKLSLGPAVELPFSEMQSAITGLEIRRLLGDGIDCLITREPYRVGPQNSGVELVIRRLEGDALRTLWKTAIEARNLAAYPPKMEILEPPELNIGRPGTDTKGEVEFRERGTLTEIVWKGKISFHALGREEPVDTISIERTWSWDGIKFAAMP